MCGKFKARIQMDEKGKRWGYETRTSSETIRIKIAMQTRLDVANNGKWTKIVPQVS